MRRGAVRPWLGTPKTEQVWAVGDQALEAPPGMSTPRARVCLCFVRGSFPSAWHKADTQ